MNENCGEVAVNAFVLEYATLLVVLLIAAYNVISAPDDDERSGHSRSDERGRL